MVGWDREGRLPKDQDKTRLAADEATVCRVVTAVEAMINPWEDSESLVSLSSGSVASEDITADLLGSQQKGISS